MTRDILHLVVEDEPYLLACRAWRRRYDAGVAAAFALARSLGANGYFRGFDDELIAITVVDPPPPGWVRAKRLRVNHQPRLVPARGPAGVLAREAIGVLPAMPGWQEIARLIGHPCQVRYRLPGDRGGGFSTCGVGFWALVDLSWVGEQYMIRALDTVAEIAKIRATHPDAIIEQGVWSPPPGLRVISKARWVLIEAQANVAAEEKETA